MSILFLLLLLYIFYHFKSFATKIFRTTNTNITDFDDYGQRENDEISRWSSTLSIAKITRWGGKVFKMDYL